MKKYFFTCPKSEFDDFLIDCELTGKYQVVYTNRECKVWIQVIKKYKKYIHISHGIFFQVSSYQFINIKQTEWIDSDTLNCRCVYSLVIF